MRAWLLAAAACKGGGEGVVGEGPDTDGDGLSDEFEAGIGSNPEAPDTDRDGWDDRAEVDGNTDPLNGYEHPYTGGWPIGACVDGVGATGNAIGGVAEDFALMDQHLDGVRLHAFCDRVVVMAASAPWCDPCRQEAPFLAAMYTKYAAQGLMVITLLGEDVSGNTASAEDLTAWADEYGATHPVLQDVGFSVAGRFKDFGSTALPANTLLGHGLVVQATELPAVTEADIVELLAR
jgi:thiol-disulfide isomerase/thioredoxin